MRLHIVELVTFSAYAELRAERARSYLGFLWWLIDPALQMGIYYLIFSVVLKTSTPDFVPFLLIGLTVWQWFKSCVSHGGHAIWLNLSVIRQVKLPTAVFPTVQILADTIKFLVILFLLLVVLWSFGYPPNTAYAALPVVFVVVLVFAAASAYFIAALMPLLPDLRFIIEQLLMMMMMISGIVFSVQDVTPPLRSILMLNPMVELVDATRGILMRGEWPNWIDLGEVAAISSLLYVAALLVIARLTPRYVKLSG
jgi:lipopolysaccharide transport system permease protein